MNYDTQKLDMAFNSLPDKLQDFIMSDEVVETVDMFIDEYSVPHTAADTFSLIIFAILCGIGTIDELNSELAKYGLDEDRRNSLLIDIDEMLLDPAYDYLVTHDEKVLSTSHNQRLVANPSTQFTDLINSKLTSSTSQAKEEIKIGDTSTESQDSTAPTAPQPTPEPQKPVYKGPDPYREPLQ